ncbi:Acetylcholinesterase [Habropoda laboriosa]|uniref:Carboxylic ester hydrolase n=1 Tax=Habropoda laboriosa TaxID=597456 RepID=A0A0L7R886_9HYME|nr:Acetylcholinesterase [Habropoda laboriosa]
MILVLCVVLLASTVHGQRMSDVVQTDKGPVQGRIFETLWYSKLYSAFEGIPFGKPPVGPLRFRKTVEADPWTDVINATKNTISCSQAFILGPTGDEDCLYLNVFTPLVDLKNITSLKAVLVWIYGGAFTMGSSLPGVYGPDFFLEKDIVFVSFNYRVDVLGFLALDVEGAEGNAGLWDQVFALRWVKKNIAAFGGDPNQITLAGESAGAASVGYHLLIPESAGLFNKIILQSGTPLSPWAYHSRANAIQSTLRLANALGCYSSNQTEVLEFMEKQNLHDLLMLSHRVTRNLFKQGVLYYPFVPTSTNDLLADCPIANLRTGNFSKVPVLMGYNKDEAVLFSFVLDVVKNLLFDELLRFSFLEVFDSVNVFNEFAYNISTDAENNMIKLASAYYISGPVDLTQRYITKYNSDHPVYYYHLAYDSKYNLHRLLDSSMDGVAHADDLGFLFNIGVITPIDPLDTVNLFRNEMVTLWANFAKYRIYNRDYDFSNPTPNNETINGAVWQPSGVEGLQLDINTVFTMKNRTLSPEFQEMEKYYDIALPYATLCSNPSMIANETAFP